MRPRIEKDDLSSSLVIVGPYVLIFSEGLRLVSQYNHGRF